MITTSIREVESPRQVSVVSVCHKGSAPNSPVSTLPPLSPLSPGTDINEFERQAKLMLDRMDNMLRVVKSVGHETDPGRRLEVNRYNNLCLKVQ